MHEETQRGQGQRSPASAQGAAGGPVDATSAQTLQREWQVLTSISRTLGVELGRLVQVVNQITARAPSSPAAPPNAPPPQSPLATPPSAGAPPIPVGTPSLSPSTPSSPSGGGGYQVNERFVRDLLAGTAGIAGVGLGMHAAFGDLTSMAARTRALEEGTFQAAVTSGRLEDGDAIYQRMVAGPGYRTLTGPLDRTRALTQFRQQGTDASPDVLAAIGDMGYASQGSAAAGYSFASGLYRDTRTTPKSALESQSTLIEYGLRTSQGVGELVDEFRSMNRYLAGQGGTRAVGDDEMDDRRHAFAYLRSLPGAIGEGDGATRIAQGLSSAAQSGGMAQDIAAVNYEQRTGHSPWESVQEWHKFTLYQRGAAVTDRNLKGGVFYRDQIEGFQNRFGKDAAGWMDVGAGTSPEENEALANGTPDEQRQIIDRIREREAVALQRTRAERFGQTPGGRSIQARTREMEGTSSATGLAELQKKVEFARGDHPYLTVAGEAAGGTVVTTASSLAGPLATLSLLGGAGRAAAGATGAVGRVAGMAGRFSLLAGAAAAGYDAYDAYENGNVGPLVAGSIAAVPGMMYGGPTGAAAAYGLGSSGYRMFLGGESEAAVEPTGTGAGGGWEKSEIQEALQLLRELAHPGMTGGGGTRDSVGAMPERSSAGGRISADDPRITAAADRHGLPPSLVKAVIRAESHFRVGATSPDNGPGLGTAKGLMQLLDSTGAQYGKNGGNQYDVEENLEDGTSHLARLVKRYGSYDKAVLAYHQGEGNVDAGTIGPKGRAYQERVRRFAAQYQDEADGGGSRTARQAREREDIVARTLGPDEDSTRDTIHVQINPGPEFRGFMEPQRIPMPGVTQRSGR